MGGDKGGGGGKGNEDDGLTPAIGKTAAQQRAEAVEKGRRIRELRNRTRVKLPSSPPAKKFLPYDEGQFNKNASDIKSGFYGHTRSRAAEGLKKILKGSQDPLDVADAMFVNNETLRNLGVVNEKEIKEGLGISEKETAPSRRPREIVRTGLGPMRTAKEVAKRSLGNGARVLIVEPSCAGEVLALGEENLKRLQVTVQASCRWKAEVIKRLVPAVTVVCGEYDDALPHDGYYDAVVCGSVSRREWGDHDSQELLRAVAPGMGLLITENLHDAITLKAMSRDTAVEILQNAEWIGATEVGRGMRGGEDGQGYGRLMVFRRRKEPLMPSEMFRAIQKEHGIDPGLDERSQIQVLADRLVFGGIESLLSRCPNRPLVRGVEVMKTGGLAPNIPTGCLGLIETEEGTVPVINRGSYQQQLYGTTPFESERLRELAELATGLRELRWRSRDADVEAYEDLQRVMQEKHKSFVRTFGPVSKGVNAEILNSTGDWINVVASEAPGAEGKPAGWLTAKHQGRRETSEEMTIDNALLLSLRSNGYVDLDFMGGLLEQSPASVREMLGDRVLLDPGSMKLHIRAAILSGDVVATTEAAQTALTEVERKLSLVKSESAATKEEELAKEEEGHIPAELVEKRDELRNVLAALREVRPDHVPLTDIGIKMSDKAILSEAVEAFLRDKLKTHNVSVRDLIGGTRDLQLPGEVRDDNPKIKEWSTEAYNGRQLIRIAVSKGMIGNTRKTTGVEKAKSPESEEGEAEVIDDREMDRIVANEMIERINTEFRDWLLEPQQSELAQKVEGAWNRERNRFVQVEAPLGLCDLEGLNEQFVPRDYQLRAAAKALMSNRGVFFHFPGAGKTLTTAIVANTHFRSGAKTRLLYLAPSATLEGVMAEMTSYFPEMSDKIRILTPGDFRGEQGAETLRQMLEMPYTLDMMSYDTFKVVAQSRVKLENEKEELQEEIIEQVRKLSELKKEGLSEEKEKKQEEKLKRLRGDLEKIEKEIAGLPGLNISEMGYEGVFADEADVLRNLRSHGNARGAGMSGNQLTDSFHDWLSQEQARDPRFMTILETGTLMGRSIAEYYTYQRYVQEEALQRQNINNLNDWINAFCKVTTSLSINMEGKVTGKDVVSVANHRELRNMLAHIVDVVTEGDILDPAMLPKYRDGGQIILTAEKTREQGEFYRDAMKRIGLIKARKVDPKTDNALKVYGECVAASIAGRMVGRKDEPDPENKLGLVAVGIAREFVRSGGIGTQLVFLDRYAKYEEKEGSKKRVREYDAMETLAGLLVDAGIPKEKIIRLHDVPDGRWSKELNKINEGKYAVVLTSRGLVGRGVNIQKNIIGDWHLDMPWNPNEFLQSLRRSRRQGNKNKEIFSYIVVTKGSAERLLVESNRNKMGVENDFWRKSEAREFTSLANDFEPSLMVMESEILGGDNRLKELAKIEGELKRAEGAVKRENHLRVTLPVIMERLKNDLDMDTKWVGVYSRVVAAMQEYREEREKAAEAILSGKEEVKELVSVPPTGHQESKTSDVKEESKISSTSTVGGNSESSFLGMEIMGEKVDGLGLEEVGKKLIREMMRSITTLKRSTEDQRMLLGSLCGGRVKIVGIKAGWKRVMSDDEIALTMDEKSSHEDFAKVSIYEYTNTVASKIIGAMKGIHLRLSHTEKRCEKNRRDIEGMEQVLAKCGDSSEQAAELRSKRDELIQDLSENPPDLEGALANVIPRTPAESKVEMGRVLAPLRREVLHMVELEKRERQAEMVSRMKTILSASANLDAGEQKTVGGAGDRLEGVTKQPL